MAKRRGKRTIGIALRPGALTRARVWARLRRYRFVDKQTGCWIWTGTVNSKVDPSGDYGRTFFRVDGARHGFYVHRLSLWIFKRFDLGATVQANHATCHNSRCFNPRHLKPGTQVDNMAQKRKRDQERYAQYMAARAAGEAHAA